MKKNKYKILVLAGLKESVSTTLKSAVSLAKMIQGEIDFFYVKNATSVIKSDNQLSAIRSINHDYTTTNKEIETLITSVSNEYNVKINYSFAFSNVKHKITDLIKEKKPDIIVLGKKKANLFNIPGNNMISFVLKQYTGTILIADANNTLEPSAGLSLGMLNNYTATLNTNLAEDLLAHTEKPIKSFKIIEKSEVFNETNNSSNANIIDYIFEQNDNSINTLSNYITKNNINLLYVDRTVKSSKNKSKSIKQEDINKLNVSLLLTTGTQNYKLQHSN